MGWILGSVGALAVLFVSDRVFRHPYLFNEPRHFLGGLLAALLVGACWERINYESFRVSGIIILFPGLIAGAMLLGLAFEAKQYLWDNPQLIASGRSTIEMIYNDTYGDFLMDFVGAFTGAAFYLMFRYPK